MADSLLKAASSATDAASSRGYLVVARRYRPQGFTELIGQEHVAKALSGAIATGRIGHAYLFTGARGVGKTSTARILAKALNCARGPTSTPCNECESCQAISTGDDVDVIEMDGASNRGIDEIRQLRQNAGVRPSRSRYKIYIIDEVHMLTKEAFNALLKTLEEPPEHVKFIFCTTDAAKIPITILSRCQRFEFAGILTRSIAQRLQQIAASEGVEAEPDALAVLARRANGSMRDSQSLLEQILSFAPERITADEVHAMLGTAGDERLSALVQQIAQRNPAGALAEIDAALMQGVDLPQFLEQVVGYLRDCMVALVGCPADAMLYTAPADYARVAATGKTLGLETLLAAMQILDQALARLRVSTQGRVIAELAMVRICRLEDLEELPRLIAQVQAGAEMSLPPRAAAPAGEAAKKKFEPALNDAAVAETGVPTPPTDPGQARSAPHAETVATIAAPAAATRPTAPPVTEGRLTEIWSRVLEQLSGIAVEQARGYERIAISGPSKVVVTLPATHALGKDLCEKPEQKARFERAWAEAAGERWQIEFTLSATPPAQTAPSKPAATTPHQRLLEITQHPLVQRAQQLFGAQPVRVDPPDEK